MVPNYSMVPQQYHLGTKIYLELFWSNCKYFKNGSVEPLCKTSTCFSRRFNTNFFNEKYAKQFLFILF